MRFPKVTISLSLNVYFFAFFLARARGVEGGAMLVVVVVVVVALVCQLFLQRYPNISITACL